MTSGEVTTFECRIKRANGDIANLVINGQVIFDENNIPAKLIGTSQDITDYVSLKNHSQELSNIIDHSSSEIYILKEDTFEYLYVNDGACNALGYSREELLQLNVFDINPTLTIEKVNLLKIIHEKNHGVANQTIHRRKDGSMYHVQSYIHSITYNTESAYVVFDVDISDKKETEQLLKEQNIKLNHQANYDKLTNLPNRTLFKNMLSQSISLSKKEQKQFALLIVDLDQFKKINDSIGHHIGDEIIIEIANRINSSLKINNTLARLGGDEFAIILKDIQDIQIASRVAQIIIDTIKEPIETHEHTLFISASVGISLFPKNAQTEDDLMKFADAAMYKAKDEGRDNFQFYSADMTALAFEKVVMESSLKIAIKEEQFIVYYQPQINSIDNTIIGFEALVRWMHPQIGLVLPGKFIPLAEENGFIIDIDKIVMQKSMSQFVQWYKEGLNPGILSLNLAMKQLNSDTFVYEMLKTMNQLGFKPEWLELEVTESQVMNNPQASIEKLNKISSYGIEIAIDDFGTGYSSLTYLKKLPLDKLKIDQSFVRDIPEDDDDAAITKAIIALGTSLNLKIIAEGVEKQEQMEFLTQNGCHIIQGFFYARPMPGDEIPNFLNGSKKI
ncbi:EAL domain-containing protein [bacterium]|nr:EAL domain-containing protein [bacterium]